MISASTSINVRFAETDAMGVVYHANYLPWCECARIKLLESFGANYADMYTAGIHLPVVEECLKYKSPAKFGDSVTIVAQIRQKPFARIKVEYEIKVGERIAESVRNYFNSPENQEIISRLRAKGLKFKIDENERTRTDVLQGKTFVISGTFKLHSREEYKQMIEDNGGKNQSSVSAKTNYILAGDNMGPAKLEKAQKLGVAIIDEQAFLGMIAANGTITGQERKPATMQPTLFD